MNHILKNDVILKTQDMSQNIVIIKNGLETQLKSLFYLFVRLYAILCMIMVKVTEPIVF